MSNRFRPFFLLFALLASVVATSSAGAVNGTEPITTVAGGNGLGSGSNQLALPAEVAIDSDGNLYIADTLNSRVQKVTTEGIVTTIAGSGGQGSNNDQLAFPYGLTVDSNDNLYIADTNNHRIQKVTTEGIVTTVAGGNGPGSNNNQLNKPWAVAVDSDGNLYIGDILNYRIQRVTTEGTVTTIAGGNGQGSNNNQLNESRGVSIDSDGNLYIADTWNHRIQKVDAEGIVTTIAGGNGAGDANNQLQYPAGVAVDSDGILYIADTNNNRIQKLDTTEGTVAIIAGGNGQGSANNQLSQPVGVGVGSNGDLYIADTSNNRIQKLTADNTNPTIAITAPTPGQNIVQNADLTAAYSCDDNQTILTCTATLDDTPINNGATINTSATGTKTLTVTATDASDNTATKTVIFTIYGPREIIGSHAADTGSQGSISRLYMAVFQRQPDAAGHTYWNTKMSEGMSLQDAAYHFVTSTEFTTTYADLDNQEFVELLYQNVMNRQGENAGVIYWTGILDNGTSRADVTLLFSESAEFKVLTKTS